MARACLSDAAGTGTGGVSVGRTAQFGSAKATSGLARSRVTAAATDAPVTCSTRASGKSSSAWPRCRCAASRNLTNFWCAAPVNSGRDRSTPRPACALLTAAALVPDR
jgi:hypothetical protein